MCCSERVVSPAPDLADAPISRVVRLARGIIGGLEGHKCIEGSGNLGLSEIIVNRNCSSSSEGVERH